MVSEARVLPIRTTGRGWPGLRWEVNPQLFGSSPAGNAGIAGIVEMASDEAAQQTAVNGMREAA